MGLLGREERELSLVVAHGGNYWLNHGVLAMAVVLVACHGGHGFDSEMERSGRGGEKRRRGLRLNLFCWKKKKMVTWQVRIGWRKTHLLCQL